MKIAFVIQHGKIGGIEQHVFTLSKSLKENGLTPIVIMLFSSGPMVELFEEEKIDCYILNGRHGHDLKLAFQFFKLIHSLKPDILHVHVGTLIGSMSMYFLPNMPVVVTEHMAKIGRKIPLKTKIIYSLLHAKASKIIAVSQSTRQSLENFNKSNKKKLVTMYNGIAINNYEAKVDQKIISPNVKAVIGAVGRLDVGKGWHLFLEVAKKVLEELPECHFYIIGDGPLRAELEELAKKLKIAENIHFLGFRNDVRDVLKTLDLYLLLSEYEACPISLLEVMAEKVPVSGVLPVGGVSEINADIYPLLKERDKDLIAAQIFSMLTGDYDLSDMTNRAYKRILNQFNAKKMAIEVEKLYMELLTK